MSMCDECENNFCLQTFGLVSVTRKQYVTNATNVTSNVTANNRIIGYDVAVDNEASILDTKPLLSPEVVSSPPSSTSGVKGWSPAAQKKTGVIDWVRLKKDPKHIEFSEDMFLCSEEEKVDAAEDAKVKQSSIAQPDILLGYLIEIHKNELIPTGRFLVTGIRQNIGYPTDYCVISRSEEDPKISSPDPKNRSSRRTYTIKLTELWVQLKRDEKKYGVNFTILKKNI